MSGDKVATKWRQNFKWVVIFSCYWFTNYLIFM